jgi:branched-chain amino acid transport system ATP-binding protein
VRAGIGWSPQERNIFKSLTVEENLTAIARPGAWTLERVFEMFPRLAQRRANLGSQLSGGEQQMLAIGRALIVNPKSSSSTNHRRSRPIIVRGMMTVSDQASSGRTHVDDRRVEQHARKVLTITDQALILDRGMVGARWIKCLLCRLTPSALERYVGVAGGSRVQRNGPSN